MERKEWIYKTKETTEIGDWLDGMGREVTNLVAIF